MRLEIRLLGGFEAKLTDRPVHEFESQKVRALLAYLAIEGRALGRDHLAGLFWPERSDEAARRNLRQALYSVRSSLTNGNPDLPSLVSSQSTVSLHPELSVWVDVHDFREQLEQGLSAEGPDPLRLTAAAHLYKGDLLAGFFLKGCIGFEEWLITEQERLREEALDAFRTLVQIYLSRGEHRLGIRYAKRLLSIDPLLEDAHRQLMGLYVMAGRRDRALAQFEHLQNLLQEELGVDPLDATSSLYKSILLQPEASAEPSSDEEQSPPLVPLVGRREVVGKLQQIWQSVVNGQGRLTVLSGESGVGKSRLSKSFVDRATSQRHAVVLRGRCYGSAPVVSFRPFVDIVEWLFSEFLADEPETLSRLEPGALADLLLLCPKASEFASYLGEFGIGTTAANSARMPKSFLELLDAIMQLPGGGTRPLILMIEDLQHCDAAGVRWLEELALALADRPMWILVTSSSDAAVAKMLENAKGHGQQLPLGRLTTDNVDAISKALVDLGSATELTDFLWRAGQGLPLALTELINLLWDERILIQSGPAQWALTSGPGDATVPDKIEKLISRRIAKLPNSSRRLLSLASILGHQFNVDILKSAADEHLTVVETCIELALERWLVRQFPKSWSNVGLQSDLVLWARGARRGFFEFSHGLIRTTVLAGIKPLRRQIMHVDVALALEDQFASDPGEVSEHLAFHYSEAGDLAKALPWLEHSATKAELVGGLEIATWYRERAAEAGRRLGGSKKTGDGTRFRGTET